MINKQTFKTLLKKGIHIRKCRKVNMDAKVYLLSLKWVHVNREVAMDVLLVFLDDEIHISVHELFGDYYHTEYFRYEVSRVLEDIKSDISSLSQFRYPFLYRRVVVSFSPAYIIPNIERYEKRLMDDLFMEKEADRLLREITLAKGKLDSPIYRKSDIYFQRIILYGNDGVKLAELLNEKNLLENVDRKRVDFPNAVCQFKWVEVEEDTHNQEEVLTKIWYRYLKKYQYACEIIFNEYQPNREKEDTM